MARDSMYVSVEYFRARGRFEDFVVHEAAHVFHNVKCGTVGLRETRTREWLLDIDFTRRETFAYACEAFSRIRELGGSPAARRRLVAELEITTAPAADHLDVEKYVDILREAVLVRNGWKRILERCAPQSVHSRCPRRFR